MSILTTCAACATELGLTLGKKCGRCSTRYCGPECQKQHWDEGGHDKLCKKIKKAGGAEQYNANKKYSEAVAVAAEKCADDTKGQTCFICTQALHWKTKEGLVRGCSCRGTSGFAHVSCLAEQAKILCDEAEENNLYGERGFARWARWYSCSLCEQEHHGLVLCALGWACWKTYVGRPETDNARGSAMSFLANGLSEVGHHEEALSVQKAEVSLMGRLGDSESNILAAQGNLSNTYANLGRHEEALLLKRNVYSGVSKLYGEEHRETLRAATNYAAELIPAKRFEEVKALLRKILPVARRVTGESSEITLRMRWSYAEAFYEDRSVTLDDLREAVTTLEDLERTAQRVMGGAHPTTAAIGRTLQKARAALGAREAA